MFNSFSSNFAKKQGLDESSIANFNSHIEKAEALLKFGFKVTLLMWQIFGDTLSKLPLLSQSYTGLISIAQMHKNLSISRELKPNLSDLDTCDFPREYKTDELIVGSGPGGAISAYYAINDGRQILMVEAGVELDKNSIHHGVDQLMRDFSYGGQQAILGNKIIPFAQGKVIGGGSEINSGLYHRLPLKVKEEWCKLLELELNDWEKSEEFIEELIKVDLQNSQSLGIYSNSPIISASNQMGWAHAQIPRWRKYSASNSFEHFGMFEAVIKNLPATNFTLLANHSCIKFSVINKSRIEIQVVGKNCSHSIIANHVTLSAGSVSTPRILLRSGLAKPKDFSFNFHAMSRVIAEFTRPVNDTTDIDPHQAWKPDYSIKFGAAVGTPEMLRATLSALGGETNQEFENLGAFYASVVPAGRSGFFRSPFGFLPWYKLSQDTLEKIKLGTNELTQGLKMAGAINVFSNPAKPSISSVHIFGSMPIGLNSLVDKNGVLKCCPSVRISDGSLLPTAPIVNPQGPLLTLTKVLAEKFYSTS